MPVIITLQPGRWLLVNGMLMVSQKRAKIVLLSHGRFLYGKQYLTPEQVTTPLRRLYHALQQVYAGPEDEKEDQRRQAAQLRAELGAAADCVSNVFHTDDPVVFLRLLNELRRHIERQERIAA